MVQHARARHGKRLPQVLGDSGNLSTPVTLTITQPVQGAVVTPTVTVFVTPQGIPNSPSSLPPPIPTTSPGADNAPSIIVAAPTPSPSVSAVSNNGGKSGQPSGASSTGTPVGAIVGIVLAIVLLLIAAVIFWFRRRAVAHRMKKRGWANGPKKNPPSFLWIEPKDNTRGISPFPGAVGPPLVPNRGGSPMPGNMYGTGQMKLEPQRGPYNNGLPYIPPPVPPTPPRAAGLYDYPTTTPQSAGAPSVRIPGNSPIPTVPPTPVTTQAGERAKVVSTFIPTLPDELSITTGEVIQVHAEYDDGGALCSNGRGEMGMAPVECLDKGSLGQPAKANREYRKSVRASSLAARSFTAGQQ